MHARLQLQASSKSNAGQLTEGADVLCHLWAFLVVAAHGVGQPRIGVAEHGAVGAGGQVGNVLLHVRGTQGAVQANGQRLGVADAVPERLVGLTAQRAPRVIHNGAADEHRDAHALQRQIHCQF